MESRMGQFKEFANRHPLLKDEVRKGARTWQNIYEEWTIYGENDPQWQKYAQSQQSTQSQSNGDVNESVKNIVGYIQKINPDSINKTLNTVQKVVQIIQSVGGGSKKAQIPTQNMMPSMYNDWWD